MKRVVPSAGEPPAPRQLVRRIGAVNWDCSVPSDTFFGKATTWTLGPAKWRDRTPYYADILGEDKIEHHDRSLEEYEVEMRYAIDAGIDYFAYCWYDLTPPPGDKSPCAGHLQEITRARRLHVRSALRDTLSLCAILVTWHPYSDECLRDLAGEMKNPWYEKVDGRPLVFLFSSSREVAPRLRAFCREAGAPDPYVVRNYRDYGEDGRPAFEPRERPWRDSGAGFHIVCHGFANLTVRGEPGAEIRFADSTRGGFGFFGCTETVLKDIAISYRDNPSTQGTILSVEKDPVLFVFRRDPGYPDPDERRFTDAHSNRFTVHEGDAQLFAPGGTGRMGTVERLSEDTFRFRPFRHMEGDPYWQERKAGERISVIARYSESAKGHPVHMRLCSFSGAEGVTVFDAPGQSVLFGASTAMRLIGCTVKVRPGRANCKSNGAP